MADTTTATATPPPPTDADDDEATTAAGEQHGESGQASKDLDRVASRGNFNTDERDEFDAAKLGLAIQEMTETIQHDKQARKRREDELAKINVNDADVALVMAELDVPKGVAERKLRLHNNNVAALLREVVNS